MGNMYEFSKLRNNYKTVFDRALEGCSFYYAYEHEIAFIDVYDRVFKIYVDGNKVKIVRDFDDYSSIENIEFPDKYNSYIRSVETTVEKKENDNRVEVIQRFYGKKKRNDDYFVVNLFANTRTSNSSSDFECHILGDEVIAEVDHEDISNLYTGIKGSRKVEKIFDLYRGKRSRLIRLELKDISEGILDEKCFNYIENAFGKEQETYTVGNSKVYEKI